jgi:hypothetical protein
VTENKMLTVLAELRVKVKTSNFNGRLVADLSTPFRGTIQKKYFTSYPLNFSKRKQDAANCLRQA